MHPASSSDASRVKTSPGGGGPGRYKWPCFSPVPVPGSPETSCRCHMRHSDRGRLRIPTHEGKLRNCPVIRSGGCPGGMPRTRGHVAWRPDDSRRKDLWAVRSGFFAVPLLSRPWRLLLPRHGTLLSTRRRLRRELHLRVSLSGSPWIAGAPLPRLQGRGRSRPRPRLLHPESTWPSPPRLDQGVQAGGISAIISCAARAPERAAPSMNP